MGTAPLHCTKQLLPSTFRATACRSTVTRFSISIKANKGQFSAAC